jgi:hypothetical protein
VWFPVTIPAPTPSNFQHCEEALGKAEANSGKQAPKNAEDATIEFLIIRIFATVSSTDFVADELCDMLIVCAEGRPHMVRIKT